MSAGIPAWDVTRDGTAAGAGARCGGSRRSLPLVPRLGGLSPEAGSYNWTWHRKPDIYVCFSLIILTCAGFRHAALRRALWIICGARVQTPNGKLQVPVSVRG